MGRGDCIRGEAGSTEPISRSQQPPLEILNHHFLCCHFQKILKQNRFQTQINLILNSVSLLTILTNGYAVWTEWHLQTKSGSPELELRIALRRYSIKVDSRITFLFHRSDLEVRTSLINKTQILESQAISLPHLSLLLEDY